MLLTLQSSSLLKTTHLKTQFPNHSNCNRVTAQLTNAKNTSRNYLILILQKYQFCKITFPQIYTRKPNSELLKTQTTQQTQFHISQNQQQISNIHKAPKPHSEIHKSSKLYIFTHKYSLEPNSEKLSEQQSN